MFLFGLVLFEYPDIHEVMSIYDFPFFYSVSDVSDQPDDSVPVGLFLGINPLVRHPGPISGSNLGG